jgi:hypothetical protein
MNDSQTEVIYDKQTEYITYADVLLMYMYDQTLSRLNSIGETKIGRVSYPSSDRPVFGLFSEYDIEYMTPDHVLAVDDDGEMYTISIWMLEEGEE